MTNYLYERVARRLHREHPDVGVTGEKIAVAIESYRRGDTNLQPWEIAAIAGVREYGVEVEVAR